MSSPESPVVVEIPALPQDIEGFRALRDALATTPEGGASVMVLALLCYALDPDASLGSRALTVSVDRSRLVEAADGYQGWALGQRDLRRIDEQLRNSPWIPNSYVAGTSPANGYTLSDPPYHVRVGTNPHSGDPTSGRVKVFVRSTGAASPRPVTLCRNNRGVWKAVEWSSLVVGVAPPEIPVDDTL
jgi:hypothetical protein